MKKLYRVLRYILLLLYILLTTLTIPVCADDSLNTGRPIRIGFVLQKDNAEKTEDGTYSGINVEYAYKIGQYANLDVEIILFQTGGEALPLLENGTIDMMCNVIKTPDREQKYLFSEYEVGRTPFCVFIRRSDDRFSFGNVRQLAAMTFAAEEKSKVRDLFTRFCHNYGITPAIRTYANIAEVKTSVDTAQTDAGLYGAPSVDGYQTIQNFAPLPYYFIFRKDDWNLKTKVDDAMGSILAEDSLYYDRLVQKYAAHDHTMATLTRQEKEYIASHPVLTIAVVENDAPYYTADNGNSPQGIIPDFYKNIATLTGLTFSYKTYSSPDEAISAVARGETDILGIYNNGQIPAYSAGLRITHPYASVDTVLITRTGTPMENVSRIAIKSLKQAADKNNAPALPNAQYDLYDNTRTCIQALKLSHDNAMICDMPTATWIINQNQIAAYSIMTLNSLPLDLCAATAYENSMLCSILSKAVSASSYSFNKIVTDNTLPENRWETYLTRIPSLWITAAATLLLALVIGLILALLTLRRRQKEREAIYRTKQETERREAQIAVLAKSAETRNNFFSTISHDMRTPLNAILGFTRLARKEGLPPQQRKDYLEKVETSGNLLLDLINDTLTISKANSGKLTLKLEPVSSFALFESIIIPIRHAAASKQITLIEDQSHIRDRMILADKLSIQKIFLNLLSNAVKYTPAGGHIWFTSHYAPGPEDTLDTLLVIKDDGIGISQEFLPHIFDPFAQEKQPGYESVGTGLGLAIVKQFVTIMGGTITAESEKGKGSTFTVRLHFTEVSATAEAVLPPQSQALPANLAGKKLLICEDNALNQEIARVLLKELGLETDCAADGKKGLETFAASHSGEYAGILMDIRMPVMDGYAAARAIRALDRPDAASIPIIAMTADAFEEDIQKCLHAGMNGHIAKPIDPEQMREILLSHLR